MCWFPVNADKMEAELRLFKSEEERLACVCGTFLTWLLLSRRSLITPRQLWKGHWQRAMKSQAWMGNQWRERPKWRWPRWFRLSRYTDAGSDITVHGHLQSWTTHAMLWWLLIYHYHAQSIRTSGFRPIQQGCLCYRSSQIKSVFMLYVSKSGSNHLSGFSNLLWLPLSIDPQF